MPVADHLDLSHITDLGQLERAITALQKVTDLAETLDALGFRPGMRDIITDMVDRGLREALGLPMPHCDECQAGGPHLWMTLNKCIKCGYQC
jgi:hypothetical protein